MSYYNYHAKAKQLIADGHLVNMRAYTHDFSHE